MNGAAFVEKARELGVSPPTWFCAVCQTHAPQDPVTKARTGDIDHRQGCWWKVPAEDNPTIPQG